MAILQEETLGKAKIIHARPKWYRLAPIAMRYTSTTRAKIRAMTSSYFHSFTPQPRHRHQPPLDTSSAVAALSLHLIRRTTRCLYPSTLCPGGLPRRSVGAGVRAFCAGVVTMGETAVSYLTQREAAAIDEELMGPLGFSVDQLMELAGLSVAASISEVYKASEYKRVLVICGPGNNGGDGLVAARHLVHFGYKPAICYPKRTAKPLYSGLVTQLESLAVPFQSAEDLPLDLSHEFDILLDAMFGFSFHGSPRPPFDDLIQRLIRLGKADQAGKKSPAIVSVDIPSGWHVEEGDIDGQGFKPDMLVSLTAPKLCAKQFHGPHHFLGGRFVPAPIAEKYKIHLPLYPGTSMCVRIGKPPKVDISAMRENYVSPELREDQVEADPIDQFKKWFEDAVAAGLREPNAMALSTSGKDGRPSSRVVLLKGVDKDGFVWYTNYGSRKAHELSENPWASILFYWEGLNRQVRVEGFVEKVSDQESEQYFHSRPRGSQIGAIVSNQSNVVPGRLELHQQYKELVDKFSNMELIPKPKHWGGYRLKAEAFEFWQGQPSRLHDRLCYSPQEINGKRVWKIERLAP